jgi:hypothetical protein
MQHAGILGTDLVSISKKAWEARRFLNAHFPDMAVWIGAPQCQAPETGILEL